MSDHRSQTVRYFFAVLTVAFAGGLASLLPFAADPSHFTLFFAAVVASAWYGGHGPGVVATVLSALSLDYFFIDPNSLSLDWGAVLRLSVFLLVSAVISSLTAARRRAEGALRRAHDELEERVKERTAALAKANESLQAEIVERKLAEKELWQLQREMGRVERLAALGRITGTIAHELGTPLNSVLGYTHLLAQEPLSESAQRRLRIIETQIQRMGEIIQQYLSRTRPSPRNDSIDINTLIEETLLLLNPILEQNGVQVLTRLAESLPAVCGDDASLQRVLINIIDNAVDAITGRGILKIDTRPSTAFDSKAPGIVIEITDTGTGISPEFLPKVFDLFETTKPPGKGTGLGLVVSQEIVKAHGGNLEIVSRVGEGTSVRIFLPAGGSFAQSARAEATK